MISGGASGAAVTTVAGVAVTAGTTTDGRADPPGEAETVGLAELLSGLGDFSDDIGAAGGGVADTALSGATGRARCVPIQSHAPPISAMNITTVMTLRLRMIAKWIACQAISCVFDSCASLALTGVEQLTTCPLRPPTS